MTIHPHFAVGRLAAPGLVALAAIVALTACGGGGGDDSAAPSPTPGQSLTLSGTAAVGTPISAANVSVKCATGTAAGVTGTDGSYSIAIASGAGPCIAQVTATSGSVLTTVAAGSGTSLVANITPATQLIAAALFGADPSSYFLSFDSTRAAAITVASIAAAQAQMIAALSSAGVDFSTVGDLIGAAFTSAYDTALLALSTQLTASGTSLGDLTATLANASTPSLVAVPTSLLLKPAAASCSALRSATYRVLMPSDGGSLSAQASLMTLNASTLQVAHADGTSGTWIANGVCRFSEQTGNYQADVTVSQAGVLAARYTTDGVTFRSFVGFPEQAHAVAELAGTWNVLGMTRVSSNTYVGTAGSLTYDANGAVTAATNCQNNSTWAIDVCTTLSGTLLTGIVPIVANSAGGFDLTDPNTRAVTGRLFAFQAGSGDLMLVTVDAKGELFFSAPVKSVALPAVGLVRTDWNIDSGVSLLSASAIYETASTVTSVDAAAGSWNRTHTTVGSTATRPETLSVNSPRAGYTHRASATVTDSTGAQVTVKEFTAQAMPGMGVTPLLLTTGTKLFELSAREP